LFLKDFWRKSMKEKNNPERKLITVFLLNWGREAGFREDKKKKYYAEKH